MSQVVSVDNQFSCNSSCSEATWWKEFIGEVLLAKLATGELIFTILLVVPDLCLLELTITFDFCITDQIIFYLTGVKESFCLHDLVHSSGQPFEKIMQDWITMLGNLNKGEIKKNKRMKWWVPFLLPWAHRQVHPSCSHNGEMKGIRLPAKGDTFSKWRRSRP